MTKELYDELKEIEDRLYNIGTKIGEIQNGERIVGGQLLCAWSSLYSYLKKVEVNDLE